MLDTVRLTTLNNGIRVVTAPAPQLASVSAGLWSSVGSRHEPQRICGISHMLEHMLFKGTPRRSATAISREIEGRGGQLDAFTQEENTCYYARVHVGEAARALTVLSDMYVNAHFHAAEIERERGVIFEEMKMYEDQPCQLVQQVLTGALWPEHPVGRPVIGDVASVGRITRDDLLRFRQQQYCGANTLIAVAGGVAHDPCVELVEKLLGDVPKGRAAVARSAAGCAACLPYVDAERETTQVNMAIGYRCFGRHSEKRHALRVMNAVFGENMSSRLFQRIREKKGLAYSVHSSYQLLRDTGALIVAAGVEAKRAGAAMAAIVSELDKLRHRPVPAAELKRAKEYMRGNLLLGLESTSNQMMYCAESVLGYGRVVSPEEGLAQIDRVTVDDVMTLSQEMFAPESVSVALVRPQGSGFSAADAAAQLRAV